MHIQMSFKPGQRAEKWVSRTVLIGCILITVGLAYLVKSSEALGDDWAERMHIVNES